MVDKFLRENTHYTSRDQNGSNNSLCYECNTVKKNNIFLTKFFVYMMHSMNCMESRLGFWTILAKLCIFLDLRCCKNIIVFHFLIQNLERYRTFKKCILLVSICSFFSNWLIIVFHSFYDSLIFFIK